MTLPKTLALVFVSILLVTTNSAHAGKSVGNGGNIVQCQTRASELLDVFEAKELDASWEFGFSNANSVDERIEWSLAQLARLSPKRARFYREEAKRLTTEASFVAGAIPQVRDSGPLAVPIPKNCSVLQAAVQVPSALRPNTRKLLISKNAFDQLSLDHRAALFLHEILTAEAAQWGLQESSSLRPLVALLVSKSADVVSLSRFLDALFLAGIQTYEANGLTLSFFDLYGHESRPHFDSRDVVREAQVVFGEAATTASGIFELKGRVLFHENQVLSEATLASETQIFIQKSWQTFTAGSIVTFDLKGRLIGIEIEMGRTNDGLQITDRWTINPDTHEVIMRRTHSASLTGRSI